MRDAPFRIAVGAVLAVVALCVIGFALYPPWAVPPWPPVSLWQVLWMVPVLLLGLAVGLAAAFVGVVVGLAGAAVGLAFAFLAFGWPLVVIGGLVWWVTRERARGRAPTG